jgi:formate dehydrogenase gamma subunit
MQASQGDTVQRFSVAQRVQHLLLMLAVTVLALTGLALWFHDTAFGRTLIRLEGGVGTRGEIHRWAAGLLIAVGLWHVLYTVFTRYGHAELMRMLPGRRDGTSVVRSFRALAGARPRHGEHGKYRTAQKVQYWAIALAALSMTVTGLGLWFETATMAISSAGTISLLRVIHGFEGTLLVIFLLLWHLYEVHLRPGVFPGDGSFLHGRMSLERLRREHAREHRRLAGGVGTARDAGSENAEAGS